MSKHPIAVLISDCHYSLPTLELADKATRMAIAKSNELKVPLIVAGDLHDSKANLRGECVKAMIDTFKGCDQLPIILRGNHDAINEKSAEHSLEFLASYADIITSPVVFLSRGFTCIPYHHDAETLRDFLQNSVYTGLIIMHQGVIGSEAGHYIKDKSALTKDDLKGLRVISGHYHRRQSFDLPDCGKMDYVGNPYTLNFAEANDPPKGFQILYSDGSLEFVPTNLRKHIIATIVAYDGGYMWGSEGKTINNEDLLMVKLRGPSEVLAKWTKDDVRSIVQRDNFKLDTIPTETKTTKTLQAGNQTTSEVMDKLIDSLTETSAERKTRLKTFWRDFT